MMSGLLITYSLIRELQHNEGRFNIFSFYLHRCIRLYNFLKCFVFNYYFFKIFCNIYYTLRISPIYYISLGLIATILVYLGSGLLWHFVHKMSQSCRLNWWTHFLHVDFYYAILSTSVFFFAISDSIQRNLSAWLCRGT